MESRGFEPLLWPSGPSAGRRDTPPIVILDDVARHPRLELVAAKLDVTGPHFGNGAPVAIVRDRLKADSGAVSLDDSDQASRRGLRRTIVADVIAEVPAARRATAIVGSVDPEQPDFPDVRAADAVAVDHPGRCAEDWREHHHGSVAGELMSAVGG